MPASRLILACLLLSIAAPARAVAGVADALTADQISQLKSGQLVVTSRTITGGAWPELTVYTLVNAPVSVVESVFRDYAHAQDFQKGLISANVLEHPSPDVYVVAYTSKLPLVGKTTNTVQNTFESSSGGLTVSWKLLKSDTADVSDGSLRVEPYGNGSILRYTNYVQPKSAIAGLAKWAAADSVKTTVTELKTEAERRAARP